MSRLRRIAAQSHVENLTAEQLKSIARENYTSQIAVDVGRLVRQYNKAQALELAAAEGIPVYPDYTKDDILKCIAVYRRLLESPDDYVI